MPLFNPADLQLVLRDDEEKQLLKTVSHPNRTLLPSPVASIISAGTGIGALGVKASTRIAGWGLYAGREGTLRTLSLSRTAAETIFYLAGQDVASHTTSELGQQDAAHILAKALGLLNSTISTASFIASTGFYTTEVMLKSVSTSTEKTLSILNAVFGSTESSKAVASVITLLTNELNKPETGEVLSYFTILSGVISFVLLQRWGRRKTLLDFRDSDGEVPIWDVVVDDRGFRADVVGTRRQETITLSGGVAAPTVTFTSPELEDEFEALERGALFSGSQGILNENDQPIPSDDEIYSRIASQVPDDAVVNVTTETIEAKTIRVDIRHKKATHIEPPPGTIMVAERLDHGQSEEDDAFNQTIIFRSASKRSDSTAIGSYGANGLHNADETLAAAIRAAQGDVEAPKLDGTTRVDDGMGTEQIDPEPAVGTDSGDGPIANQKKSRRPASSQSNHPPSKLPVSRSSSLSKDKQTRSSRQETGNKIKRALKGLSPSSSSTALKDSQGMLPRHKSATEKPLPRLPRLTPASEGSAQPTPRLFHLATRSDAHSPLTSPLISSSPQQTTYFSVQRSRRNSAVEQTDTYSVQSGSRPGSPTFRRTHTRTASTISKTKSEISLQDADGRRDGPRHHQRTRSFVPSLYSMAPKHSDEAVVLQPRRPVPPKSIYEDSKIVNKLVDEGTVPGIFPNRHLVRSVRRFSRFATASYGSSFLHLMGLTSEGKPRGKSSGVTTLRVDHHEHESFSTHTGLPADSIILSSFYDPQGVSSNTGWLSSAFSPLTHFVSLDHESKAVVLTCRGTLGFEDILTDLTCDYDDMFWQGQSYKVHRGIHAAARRLLSGNSSRVMATIKATLEEHQDYGLVLCGHSLGGAVAALVAVLIAEPTHNTSGQAFVISAPQKLLTNGSSSTQSPTETVPIALPAGRPIHVYSYGTPATVSEPLRLVTRGLITTVVNASDFVPSLSLGTFHDLRAVALHLKHDASDARNQLVDRVWNRVLGFLTLSTEASSVHDPLMPEVAGDGVGEDQWAWNLLQQLRGKMKSFKLVPPGEVFVLEMTRVFDRLGVDVKQEATFGAEINDDTKTEKVYRALGRPATRVQFKWVKDVPARFAELKFGRDMFGDHSPGRYESGLKHLEGAICEESQ